VCLHFQGARVVRALDTRVAQVFARNKRIKLQKTIRKSYRKKEERRRRREEGRKKKEERRRKKE